MVAFRKRPYVEPRELGESRRPLTAAQEQRRRLLREVINGCDPRMSDAEFAIRELRRDPRTVRKWLTGERPIPTIVSMSLEAMRPYQKRKARERARDDVVDLRVEAFERIAAAGVQPAAVKPGLGVFPRAPSPASVGESPVDRPKRKYVSALEQLAAADARRAAVAMQASGETSKSGDVTLGAVLGTRAPDPWSSMWLCRCSDAKRKVTWRKAKERACAQCGMMQPPAE